MATLFPSMQQWLADRTAIEVVVTAWADRRKATTRRIDWQFTTTDERTKLRRRDPAYAD